jgi:hypothetical protein
VPLSLYFTGGWVKVAVALARGRRSFDKRQVIAQRDADREICPRAQRSALWPAATGPRAGLRGRESGQPPDGHDVIRDYLRAEAPPERLAELAGALPGQAGLSGRHPGDFHPQAWTSSRTQQVSSLISAARQAWSYAFSGRATWPRRFSERASTARICAARKPSVRSSTYLPSNTTERTINAVYAQV